jgi:glyoxylate reductase
LLCATRRLYSYASAFAAAQSGQEEKQHEISALHVGIVGLGGIGTRIAEILRQGFGARVSYYSRTRKQAEEDRLGISFEPLEDLCQHVDVMIVMTPGNEESKGLIGEQQFNIAKPGLVIVNTARPEIVVPEALLEALQSGRVGYAAFDGFYDGPPEVVKHLKSLTPGRLMITGHVASLTHEARDGMAIKAVQSIMNMLTTGDDPCIVNRSAKLSTGV